MAVGDFVDKLITNGMIVQIPTENSVGKSKDCGSNTTTWRVWKNRLIFIFEMSNMGFNDLEINALDALARSHHPWFRSYNRLDERCHHKI